MSFAPNKFKIVGNFLLKTKERVDKMLDFMSCMPDITEFSIDEPPQPPPPAAKKIDRGDEAPLREKPKKIRIKVFLGPVVGCGTFSTVYPALCKSHVIAVKVEETYDDKNALKPELKIYKKLKHHVGVPKIFGYGYMTIERNSILLMELLGPPLDTLLKLCEGKFSLKTVCMIGLQMVDLLEYIHSQHVVHRDIKPENVMVGRRAKRTRIYLSDFGLASRYINRKTNQHIPLVKKDCNVGTLNYMSVNCHEFLEESRRDDLESLFYMLIYFLKGNLPWANEAAPTYTLVNMKMRKYKLDVPMFCKDLPREIRSAMTYIRLLEFEETPNYNILRNLLITIMEKHEFKRDNIFDWEGTYEEERYEEIIVRDETTKRCLTITQRHL